jgi:acyl-CoA synthetase (NDP forming)
VDSDAARGLVEALVAEWGEYASAPVEVGADSAAQLLGCYGIEVWPRIEVHDARGAAAAARTLGFPVVLKTVWSQLRLRSDLGGIWFGLKDSAAVRRAFERAESEFSRLEIDRYVVQRQAPAGVSVVLTSREDPLFGPVVSFGIAGMAHDVLEDRGYRVPPFTDADAEALVREPRASELLLRSPGLEPVDLAALHDLVVRVGRLADELPEVAQLRLRPVVVSPRGAVVLGARLHVARPLARTDLPARRLLG